MTHQEVFNIAAEHLLKQSARSVKPAAESGCDCRYRGCGGLKCAVGALIPDEMYYPELEGRSVRVIIRYGAPPTSPCPSYDRSYEVRNHLGLTGPGATARADLLNDLQNCHDGEAPSNWKRKLKDIARRHALDPAILLKWKWKDGACPRYVLADSTPPLKDPP